MEILESWLRDFIQPQRHHLRWVIRLTLAVNSFHKLLDEFAYSSPSHQIQHSFWSYLVHRDIVMLKEEGAFRNCRHKVGSAVHFLLWLRIDSERVLMWTLSVKICCLLKNQAGYNFDRIPNKLHCSCSESKAGQPQNFVRVDIRSTIKWIC